LRWLLAGLLLVLVMLQYRLWIAEGSLAELHRLDRQIDEQTRINAQLQQRNGVLEREVLDLQSGNRGLEQRAREQLGLIREGETYYQFVKPSEAGLAADPAPQSQAGSGAPAAAPAGSTAE
jgi:cell division protein FtsB